MQFLLVPPAVTWHWPPPPKAFFPCPLLETFLFCIFLYCVFFLVLNPWHDFFLRTPKAWPIFYEAVFFLSPPFFFVRLASRPLWWSCLLVGRLLWPYEISLSQLFPFFCPWVSLLLFGGIFFSRSSTFSLFFPHSKTIRISSFFFLSSLSLFLSDQFLPGLWMPFLWFPPPPIAAFIPLGSFKFSYFSSAGYSCSPPTVCVGTALACFP